jgi:DNA polymerase-3 subunit epsilon
MKFLAIDFETADYEPESACAVGLVRVEDGTIVARASHLIRPPRQDFVFTYLHGISWEDVRQEPTFKKLWPAIQPLFRGVDFLAAHNAGFDRNVLRACCTAARIEFPATPFQCSMVMARRVWGIHPTRLSDVCRRLDIPLRHHEADSDAEACAMIMVKALARQSAARAKS